MKIAVIGHGPASLASAWAAKGLGHEVSVIGPMEKSPLRGPVLLQRPIPGITMTHPDGYIRQIVVGGSILDYRKKLYGDVNIAINGDIMEPGYHAWRMEATYDRLWSELESSLYGPLIVHRKELQEIQSRFDLVINTAPAKTFCQDESHVFDCKEVALTWETSYPNQEENTIYFNAESDVDWVRSSNVFGNVVTEWEPNHAPEGAHVIVKPISTNCHCWPGVFRTGRFGAWRNETWVDTAYYDTRTLLLTGGIK